MIKNINKTTLAISLAAMVGFSLPVQAFTPVQLTSNTSIDKNPQIHGDHLVWQGFIDNNWEIFHHNISTNTTTQVTNNMVNDVAPQTDGSYITWLSNNSDGALSYYNIATGLTAIVPDDNSGESIKSAPQIVDGRIVWAANSVYDSGVDVGDIYLFDIASGFTMNISTSTDPNNQFDDTGPKINASTIGWIQTNGQETTGPEVNDSTYMLYDIATETTIVAPADYMWLESQKYDGDLHILSTYDGDDREIFLKNKLSTLQITDNTINDGSPCISGYNIAWVSGSYEAAEIFIATDIDTDGDGVTDSFDNCTNDSNSYQSDADGDGIGDVCDEPVPLADPPVDSCATDSEVVNVDMTGMALTRNNKTDKDKAQFQMRNMTGIEDAVYYALENEIPLKFYIGACDTPIYGFTVDNSELRVNRHKLKYTVVGKNNVLLCMFKAKKCTIKINNVDLDNVLLEEYLPGDMTVTLKVGDKKYTNTDTWKQRNLNKGHVTKYNKNK